MIGGVLYISYSGMLEPLGQSQVLSYQERISGDHPVFLISFERTEDWENIAERDSVAERMRAAGISWHPLRYHKRFSALATAWDILQGTLLGLRLVLKHGLSVVHARSYVASVMALLIKRMTGVKYIFDMRGFWADERVDGGLWPRGGFMYLVSKWFERQFFLNADHVVSLTSAAVREIRQFPYLSGRVPPVTVIPTCADLERFKPGTPAEARSFVLGYVGSVGTWYLFDAVAACFQHLRKIRPDARLLVINRHDHDYIRERLAAANIPLEAVELRAVTHDEVPREMARMQAGIFFYTPSYSRAACSPTKLGEFLGCGIPCLSNEGVGDMAELLTGEHVGVALPAFDDATLRSGIEQLVALASDPAIAGRCAQAARKHFSLAHGVASYRAVYQRLSVSS